MDTGNLVSRSVANVSRQRGFTLTEILVTVLVLSIGLLGVAGLHAWSLRNNHDALIRSHASALANDIADRMRANRQAALAGQYNIQLSSTPTDESTLAGRDLVEWRTRLSEQLPNGRGQIELAAAPSRLVTITVDWWERDAPVAVDEDGEEVEEGGGEEEGGEDGEPEDTNRVTFQTQTEI